MSIVSIFRVLAFSDLSAEHAEFGPVLDQFAEVCPGFAEFRRY
jgi:hypothetical protein